MCGNQHGLRPVVALGSLWLIAALLSTHDLHARQTVPLNGDWERARVGSIDRPPVDAEWEEATVPGFVSVSTQMHGTWFRRRVAIPAGMAGMQLSVRFLGVKYAARVYLNGTLCGSHVGGFEPFEVDVTRAARPGGDNELLVGVSDWSAIIDVPFPAERDKRTGRLVDCIQDAVLAPIGSQTYSYGIWDDVDLVAFDGASVEDVQIVTSMREKTISVAFTVRNRSGRSLKLQAVASVMDADKEVLHLPETDLEVAAGEERRVELKSAWAGPRLWWPHDPHLYELRISLGDGNKQVDGLNTRFGFREFWTEGHKTVLNGTRVNLLATSCHPRGLTRERALEQLQWAKDANCLIIRLHAQPWSHHWYEVADEIGLLVAWESAVWCFVGNYKLESDVFWNNFAEHLRAQVRLHRNHPSLVIWSVENEMTHCGGRKHCADVDKRLAGMASVIRELDSTRPIMFEADYDPEGSADILNLHYPYEYPGKYLYPESAYWMEQARPIRTAPGETWKWDKSKPLYYGEFLWVPFPGSSALHSIFLGQKCFEQPRKAHIEAKAIAWRYQIRAYRDAEVSGICPWNLYEGGALPNPLWQVQKETMQPVAAFVREETRAFFSGARIERTLTLHNDVPEKSDLELRWQLNLAGKTAESGTIRKRLGPAELHREKVVFTVPAVEERTAMDFTLSVLKGGARVFSETHSYTAFPSAAPALKLKKTVGLLDRTGATEECLGSLGVRFERLEDLRAIPDSVGVLVIGAHSVPESSDGKPVIGSERGARDLLSFVKEGGRVVCLEQERLPDCLPLVLADHEANVTFPRVPDHPILEGMRRDDLSFWHPGHRVSRKEFSKAHCVRSFLPVVDSGSSRGLVTAGLMEGHIGKGLILASQLLLVEKFSSAPAARRILANLLMRADGYAPPKTGATGLVCTDEQTLKRLQELGVQAEDLTGKLEAADLNAFELIIVAGDFTEVKRCAGRLAEFARGGGRILLHKPEARDTADMKPLLGESVEIGPNYSFPLLLAGADPVTRGLTHQELYWPAPGKYTRYALIPQDSGSVTGIVGLNFPEGDEIRLEAEAMDGTRGGNNYRKGDDHAYMGSQGTIAATINIPRSGIYAVAVRAAGSPAAGAYPNLGIDVGGQRLGSINLRERDYHDCHTHVELEAGEQTLGIAFTNDYYSPPEDRNVWIDSVRLVLDDRPRPYKPLTRPSALIKLPVGKGFVVVDLINWSGDRNNRDVSGAFACALLRNLGARFSVVAGTAIAGSVFEPTGPKHYHKDAGGFYLGDSGAVSTTIRCARTGRYRFEVTARGTEVDGIYPIVELKVDAKPVGVIELTSDNWASYWLEGEVEEGEHELRLTFTNDKYDPPHDRNLWVRDVVIEQVE